MNDDSLLITEKDFLRLQNILKKIKSPFKENLEIELDRATIISEYRVPKNLITMNSKVRYRILPDNVEEVHTLTYPENQGSDAISILDPRGCALLGLSVNQKINWMFPDGKTRTIEVLELLYQPEASGNWAL